MSWQQLKDREGSEISSDRLKVPGGWIVRSVISGAIEQTFVADPLYVWEKTEVLEANYNPYNRSTKKG